MSVHRLGEHGRSEAPDCVAVGYDGSRRGLVTLDRAADEAVCRRLPLTVVTFSDPLSDPDLSMSAQVRHERAARDEARSRLHAATTEIRKRYLSLPVSGTVVDGRDPAALKWLLEGCRVLVVGSRGRRGMRAFALGSISRELLSATLSPILVVPEPPAGSRGGPVLAGVDDGPLSPAVLRAAADEARRRDQRLQVLHAYHRHNQETPDEALTRARRTCANQLAASDLGKGLAITCVFSSANPARALVDHGRSAALLVIGCRGPLALARLTADSVSRAVLDAEACPVLVVQTGAASLRGLPPEPRSSQEPVVPTIQRLPVRS